MRTILFKVGDPPEFLGELTEDIPVFEGSLIAYEKNLYEVIMEIFQLQRSGKMISVIRHVYIVPSILKNDLASKKGVIQQWEQ